MQIPLEVGYPVENSSSDLAILKEFECKGIVRLQEEEYIKCKKCGEPIDIQEFKDNSTVNCPKCDQPSGLSSSRNKRTVIREVNRKKIFSFLNSQFQNTFGKENVSFDKIEFRWIINYKGKPILFFVYGFSAFASFLSFSENEGVILYFNERKIRSKVHNLNVSRYKYVFDDTFSSSEKIITFIDSLDFKETLEYIKFRERFEGFLSSITDSQYEKEFIPAFIEGIKQKHKELSTLYSRLQLVENTILNTKYLKKGGPGLEDFHLIYLNRYLQDGLQPETSGEAKKYRRTKFDYEDFAVAITHAAHFKNTLFFVSTNDIAPSVWNKIMLEKIDGHFRYVILDKDLMLMLLYNLDLIHLIE